MKLIALSIIRNAIRTHIQYLTSPLCLTEKKKNNQCLTGTWISHRKSGH